MGGLLVLGILVVLLAGILFLVRRGERRDRD